MTFTFAPAVRTSTPMIIGIAGPSGSGKTFTALTLAMGLAGGGRVALIDTEGRRALHYADLRGTDGAPIFRFDHCDMEAPYTPARFLEVWKQAEKAGYAVIVTDSYSDEYVGEGGLVDMADAEKVDNQAAKWAKPKAQHKLGVRWMRQSRCHLIFCLRAEEKVKLEKVFNERKGKEEIVVVPIGWQPICEKNVPYEMATSFMLTPEAPGVPRPIKIQEQHRHLFPTDRPITRDSGVALAAWCAGGVAPKVAAEAPAEPVDEHLVARARLVALDGMASLTAFWNALSDDETNFLSGMLKSELRPAARAADRHRDDEQNPQDGPAARSRVPPVPPDVTPQGPESANSSSAQAELRQMLEDSATADTRPGYTVFPTPLECGRDGKPDYVKWGDGVFMPKLRQAKSIDEFAYRMGDNAEAIAEYKERLRPADRIAVQKEIDDIAQALQP